MIPTEKVKSRKDYNKKSSANAINIVGSRVPPHSAEAEISVLGSMMLDKMAISKVMEYLTPECFYDDRNKIIFETMIKLSDNNIPVDVISLNDELNKSGNLERIGGTYYISDINLRTATSANVEYHARIVQEKYFKRALIDTSGRILERSYDDSTDALDEIDLAETEIFKISERRFSRSIRNIKELSFEAVDLIAKLVERDKQGLTGVSSGFKDLDNMLGGFQKSDFIVIAARPSMGKTALALSIARNTAVEYNIPVAFFSIEMSDIQLVMRLFSGEAHINAHDIRTGRITQDDLKKIVHKINRLADAPLFIDDSPALNISEFRAKCRRLKVEQNIQLVMIDYLQLIHAPKAESREREISIISSSLKQIAKELDIPIIALAQLNRSVEGRSDKRPMLSDLRESGSIEQDADVVLIIYRPEFYGIKTYSDNQMPTENTAEIIIGKQRNGPTGTVRLVYQKEYARFENGEFGYNDPPPGFDNVDPDEEPF